MKKVLLLFLLSTIIIFNSGCATILGGPIYKCQKIKPLPGEPQRDIRVGFLIADILLFWPVTFIDFATGAIYRPCIIRKDVNYIIIKDAK